MFSQARDDESKRYSSKRSYHPSSFIFTVLAMFLGSGLAISSQNVWNFPPFVPALPKPKFLAKLLNPNLVPRDFSAAVPFCVNILYN